MAHPSSPRSDQPGRRVLAWILGGLIVFALAVTAWFIAPFVLPGTTGSSGQGFVEEGYPTSVSAVGEDGRERTLAVTTSDGTPPTLDQLTPGDRLVVIGTGYDAEQGIYVAICRVPEELDQKPGPCLGGIPELEEQAGEAGAIEWAPSNWINQEWAWRLFGARSYDSTLTGSFTAYLVVADPVGEGVDCRVDRCGLYTRNDHTALDNRVQDIYLPVGFAR